MNIPPSPYIPLITAPAAKLAPWIRPYLFVTRTYIRGVSGKLLGRLLDGIPHRESFPDASWGATARQYYIRYIERFCLVHTRPAMLARY